MSSKLYVGNLAGGTTDESLRKIFADYGQVLDSIMMRDRESGNSRGFGYITYASPMEASAAIGASNDQDLDGNQITDNMANARATGGSGGGFGGGQGGHGGGTNLEEDTAIVVISKEGMVEAIKATDM